MQEEEYVHLKVLQMPCCHAKIIWVEDAQLKFCPLCGAEMAEQTDAPESILDDPGARITYDGVSS